MVSKEILENQQLILETLKQMQNTQEEIKLKLIDIDQKTLKPKLIDKIESRW